jgi:ferredoxin-nitrite reductase
MNDQPFSSDQPFTSGQEEYLKGFMSGVEARRQALGMPAGPAGAAYSADPDDLQRIAQDRIMATGGKLVAEEESKRRKHPLDRFDAIATLAADGKFPRANDVFLTKFHGLFYVAPAQNSFMCRLRIPGGILAAHQLRDIADLACDHAGGYADITTRANLQLREIPATAAPEILTRLADIGLTSRGSGADNVRNITGSPTAGIDPQELIDTRPHVRAIHHFILNHRELFGLPRKFNIAFDGAGRVAVLEDTNDIAFSAVTVADGHGVPSGVYYALGLGGITGHKDFARSTGVIVAPRDTTQISNAILRVFILNGIRTDRTKARLKYLLDDWGFPKFLEEIEKEYGAPLTRVPEAALLPRPPQDKHGHIGVHPQKQAGLSYIGITCAMGRLSADQLRGLADISEKFGSGTIRLTVWQNLLISDIPNAKLPEAIAAIEALGLGTQASHVRGGLIACTGNAGCKFAASNTKSHAAQIGNYLDPRIAVDHPINIHITGCHHSCAQHYVADIGLLAVKVEVGEDMVEGYDLHVGGGAGPEQKIGRLIREKVVASDIPPMVLSLLAAWNTQRLNASETFQQFTTRMTDEALIEICARELIEA